MRTLKRLLLQVVQIMLKSLLVGLILIGVAYLISMKMDMSFYSILEIAGIVIVGIGGFCNLAEFGITETTYTKAPMFDLKRMKFRNIEREIIPKNCEYAIIITVAGVIMCGLALFIYYYMT